MGIEKGNIVGGMGELLVCRGCTMDNVIKGDSMYIYFCLIPALVFVNTDGTLCHAENITLALWHVQPRDNYHVRCLPSVTSLPCRSPAIEGSPQRKTSTVDSAYGHQGIRIRLLWPEHYYCAIPHQNAHRASRIHQGNALRGPIQAKMVYDWENKEELCYRLYIEEKKSLEEIMEFMKEHHKFAPRYVPAIPHGRYSCHTPRTRCVVAWDCGLYVRWTDLYVAR